ncbi:Protein kinase domain [Sesbania bispinosa]|nr:Protein kinase domain [Sesbania bispinosa]
MGDDWQMTTAIAIEDVRREVKILRALTGHKNLVQFYEAYEDDDNGVVHRDLKPEDENATLKAIDFGLSDYVKPDERLNDIVGSAYYVAPEVLHRSYGTEADMWSIGVIAYILLCGSRPFWARTESGIFRAVLKADPNFDEAPWPSLSADAIDFVKRLLNKDYRKRLTAAQALSHPWLVNHHDDLKIPLDMIIHNLVKAYICSSSLRKSALGALAKTLTVAQLAYLRDQFTLLGPNKNGLISMQNFKTAVLRSSTDASKDSRVLDYVHMVSSIQYRKLDFEEFCAAAISVHQLEGMESWEQHARRAYELFEKDGNRPIMIEELASVGGS